MMSDNQVTNKTTLHNNSGRTYELLTFYRELGFLKVLLGFGFS